MSNLLDHIDSPEDLRKLTVAQLPALAQELREFIINIVAVKEGLAILTGLSQVAG